MVKSITYRSATTRCTGKVIRETNNLKLPTILLFVAFNPTVALGIVTQHVILSVQVLVKVVGVKPLKVINTEITVLV